MKANTSNVTIIGNPCSLERYWLFFLCSSLTTFGGGFFLICACKGFQFLTKKDLLQSKVSLILKRKCQYLVSGRTLIGKVLLSASCLFSIGSLIIYLVEASQRSDREVEICGNDWLKNQAVYYLDFSFNIFFLIMFIVKFLAVDNKILYWFSLHSLVDFSTIPPSFVSIVLHRQWLGLRFMRAFRIMSIPDMLQYLTILKTPPVIRFAQLLSILTSTVIAAAGFIQLLEMSGDWFHGFSNARPMPYWKSFYLVVVTMSTVGYGDVTCQTVSGKVFLCIFILTTLAFIASYIPEIAELIGSRKRRLRVSLQVESDMNHIVVCGNLSYRAINNFLMDFLHPDRKDTKMTKVVVMNKKRLSLDIEALLKGYFIRVVYMRESPFRVEGLKRVKMNEADACVIMANQKSKNPEVDDMRNIMRAISIKNFSSIKIIIQLLRYESKKYLENLPRWQKFVDKIVCLSQVKQSIMAAGCLTPGFSTLLANLVFTLDIKTTDKSDSWYFHYCHGASMEIYKSVFSRSFSGLAFEDAARICYSKLNLMLIGIGNYDKGKVFVNPSMQKFLVRESSFGLFICRQESDLQRVKEYCAVCHIFVEDPKLIKKCGCGTSEVTISLPKSSKIDYDAIFLQDVKTAPEFKRNQLNQQSEQITSDAKDHFSGHIVVCPGTSVKISEMKSFIIQLKNAQNSQKQDIVSFLDENDPSASEWQTFCHQQGVFLSKGSPLVWEDLKDINIEKCRMCVVLAGNDGNEEVDDEASMDSDVYSVLTTLFVRNAIKDRLSVANEKRGIYPCAMTLTEIAHDSNVILLGNDEGEPKSLHLSKSFASGQAFSTSVLDTFVSMIYCNPGAFSFIRALVNMDNDGCSFKNETLLLTLEELSLNKDANLTFGDLFLTSLGSHGIVCLGLYRYFGLYSKPLIEGDRFVITNPPHSLPVYPSDLVYCLVPSNVKRLTDLACKS